MPLPWQIIFAALGALIIALVQFDIIATVLHPEVESPLSNRFHRLTWRALHAVTRLRRGRGWRHRPLNWGMPLMVAGLIALWLALLLVGFALLYYPWTGDPAAFTTPDGGGDSFVEALYFSGVTLLTIGYGDIQPVAWPFRMVVLAEAASGVVVVSLSVAYLLAIYPALSQKRAIAAALDAEVAGQADGLPMVRRYLVEGRDWDGDLAKRLRELGLELLTLTEAHETHPVLYYAHPRRVQHSFLRILITAQSLVGLLRFGLSPDRHRGLVRHPQLLLLEQSLHYSLRRLSASLHIPVVERAEHEAERRRLLADYQGLCDALEGLGLVAARSVATAPVPVLVGSETTDTDPVSDGAPGQGQGQGQGQGGNGQRSVAGASFTYAGEPELLDPALDLSSDSPVEAYITFRLETDPHIAAYAIACGYTVEEAKCDSETTWWVGGR